MGAIVAIVFTAVPIVLVIALISAQMKQIREQEQLAATGVPASGLVLQVARTGMKFSMNGRTYDQRSLVLEVDIPGQPPYEVSVQPLIPRGMLRNILPGATIDIRVDPMNPQRVAVVLPGNMSAFGAQGPQGGYPQGYAPTGYVPLSAITQATGFAPGVVPPTAPARRIPTGKTLMGGAPPKPSSSAPIVLAMAGAVALAGAGGAAFFVLNDADDDAPDGGWCKAAAACCKTIGQTAASCSMYGKGMSGEACKQAYEAQKKAAGALGKRCR